MYKPDNMNQPIKIYFAALLTLLVTACSEEFLDRQPETSIGVENFFNTEEDLALYINNLYSVGLDYNGDRGTDNAATTGNLETKTIMTTDANSATISGGWNWGRLRTINLFLENFRNADIAPNLLNHYEGLARYFRAQFYMGMVRRYSDVPWYSTTIGTSDDELLFKDRDPRSLVVDSIMADYQFAAQHVLENQPDGAINRWVVLTHFGRDALYEGTYRKYHPELGLEGTAGTFLQMAKDAARQVMDSGNFQIHNSGNPDNDYFDLFQSLDLTSNPEVIWTLINQEGLRNSGNSETIFGNYEVSPARDLLQAYLNADGTYYSSRPDYETALFVEEFVDRDPRAYQTYAYPGWELIRTGTYAQGGGIYVQQLQKNFSGYHQRKGFVNVRENAFIQSVDVPVLRYAEVLLTYAEARAELGELTQADLDETINVLRDRVGMPHLMLNPPVDPVQQARYPNVSDPTLLEIRRERRIEMAMEGFRMNDLMRWGAGALLEKEPEGLYFPSLGKYDLTGDGIEDIILISNTESIPNEKEKNELGVELIYYRTGRQGEDASVYLENGDSGTVQTVLDRGTFQDPKHYYRPIPETQVLLNPNLQQMFGWN